MAEGQAGEHSGTADGSEATSLLPLGLVILALVFGGLLFSARAADAYAAVSGLLFAGFGVLFAFRCLAKLLP